MRICVLLLTGLCLALSGVAEAYYSDVETSASTLSAGCLDMRVSSACSSDGGERPDPGLQPAAHVASTDVAPGQGEDEVVVSLENGYPRYESDVCITLENVGTVAGTVRHVGIVYGPGGGVCSALEPGVPFGIDLGGETSVDLSVALCGDPLGATIPVGSSWSACLHLEVSSAEQRGFDAEGGLSGDFTVVFQATEADA